MSFGRVVRLAFVALALGLALICVWRTKADPIRVSLFVTAVIGAVTAVYALFTYEILIQNQAMAKAAVDSSILMERSLRFSHSANLLYQTINTRDPTFPTKAAFLTAVDNDDYKRALLEFGGGSGQQKEFVFAVVRNKGQGPATSLIIDTLYNITDSSNPNRETSVTKQASVPILEAGKEVALCVFISKVPTADDRVALVSARLTASDFYRDAISEPAQQINIDARRHHVESEPGCVVRVT
jgi:phosphate/sulfate permease